MLSQFSIIASLDGNNGISKEGVIPCTTQSTGKCFKELTCGRGRNAVIMGRVTYESIPEEARPLEKRHNIVISRLWKQENNPSISVFNSFLEALEYLGGLTKAYDNVFVMGGEQIFREAILEYKHLIKRVYITKFKTDYDCDQFFPFDAVSEWPLVGEVMKTKDFCRYVYEAPSKNHEEYKYLDLLRKVVTEGEQKMDRTGTGVTSVFGAQVSYDISKRIPILTTKKVNYESVIKELLFFIGGKSDTKILEAQNVKIWSGNTSREFLDKRELRDYEVGDMGPSYPHQWRHWGAEYEGCDKNYSGLGIDQLSNVIKSIREDPHSRRHIISAWNVEQISKMCIPPCHVLVQFNVSGDRKHLDCFLLQRSADMFLGVPFNIASYAILTYMIAHVTNLKPRNLIHSITDAHVYSNHMDQVKKQLSRTPRPFPRLSFRGGAKLKEIDDFSFGNFVIEGYVSCPYISAPMAV